MPESSYDAILKALYKETKPAGTNIYEHLLGLYPPYQAPPLNSLAQQNLAFKKENLYFRDKKIDVDGYEFINCRFDNCTLNTIKGTFKFKNCVFDTSTVVSYSGTALKVLKLYNRKSQVKSDSLSATINPDGTITIE